MDFYTPNVYSPPISHYSQLSVPEYVTVGLLVGKNGRHFKNITYESGCRYIWYDKDRKVVEIWGPLNTLEKARTLLQERFETFKPDKTLEELKQLVKNTNEYTRPNGNKVIELEGPEWAVRDFCNKSYDEFMVDEAYNIGETFWTKIVFL